ncbi:unnamed protein product [Paramecium pentaurelia]|uniref:RING-type domain-containing protein n=1 Tax=Paramecium pentaurelia TaxID=43138 RepID=A0A8S1TJQ0_9CILI|nr:unnamed protein product [Paramecium pentaurelia]
MFLTRQGQVRIKYASQQKNFHDNVNRYNFERKTIVIDYSNIDIEKQIPEQFTKQNYKYCSQISNVDYKYDILIINPALIDQIKTNGFQVVEIQTPVLPIEQRRFLSDYNTQEQKLQLIHKTVISQINEERDILIYCMDANEIEYLRVLFEQSQIRVIVKIDNEFNQLFNRVMHQPNYSNTVFLLMEPQQLESYNITLIIHTNQREIIKRRDDNTIEYSYQILSQVDLQVREISKSNSEGIMIYYAFSEQQYLQLAMQAQKSSNIDLESDNFEKLLCNLSKQEDCKHLQKFGIMIAALFTSGQLLQIFDKQSLQKQLSIKTSSYWSKQGDYHSWYNIIMQIIILLNSCEDEKISSIIKKFCNDNKINLIKALLIIAKLKYFSSLYEIDDLDVLDGLQQLNLKKQSSSIDGFQTDNEYQLEQLFPISRDYKMHKYSLQKIFKIINLPQYILGIKENQVLYSAVAENKFRKISVQEHIVQNICTAVMNLLWNDEESEISKLEHKYKCIIEPFNINNLVIYSDNSKQVEDELLSIISKFKQQLSQQIKEYEYQNSNIRFIISNGGVIDKCYYSNNSILEISQLSLETKEAEIRSLIEPYSLINTITLIPYKISQTAQIDLRDKDATLEIINDLDETEFQGCTIKVSSTYIKKEQNKKFHPYIIKLSWFIYHCKGNAEITFNNEMAAQEFYNQYNDTILDGKKMIMQVNNDIVHISNLTQYITELDLFRLSTKIKSINISKSVLYEPKFDIFQKVESLLFDENRKHHIGFKHQQLYRIRNQRKDYKRVLKLGVPSINFVNSALTNFNNLLIQLGLQQVKLYCEAQYKHQYKVKQDFIKFVRNNIKSIQQKFNNLFRIEQVDNSGSEIELHLVSDNYMVFSKVRDTIQNIIDGYIINFGELNTILFSDVGQQFIQELEIQKSVIISLDQFKKIIKVYCLDEQFQELQDIIKSFLESNSTITVRLTPQKLKKLLGDDYQGLLFLQQKFKLTDVVPIKKNNQLKLSGQAKNLEEAIQYLEAFLESKDENIENQSINQDNTCCYCLNQMKQPYILTNCNHKFCNDCLNYDFSNSIKDINSLPIKCSLCQNLILLEDIQNILGLAKYEKLVELSINKYVNDMRGLLIFCFNPGCSNILRVKGDTVYCENCKVTYCLKCKVQMHYGMTCWEYQTGDQKIMEELMKKEDIRFCPVCRSLAQKISGCMSVACSSCKKYICWKNLPNSSKACMKVFNNSTECHQHLTNVHGGYY